LKQQASLAESAMTLHDTVAHLLLPCPTACSWHVQAIAAVDDDGCEPPIPQLPEAVVEEVLLYVPNCLSTCAAVSKTWAAAAVRATTRRKQEHEKLMSALASPMGFHKGKPLAALVVFRACLQWRAFQSERTKVFDGILQVGAGWGAGGNGCFDCKQQGESTVA
jgi:hypothetical protein